MKRLTPLLVAFLMFLCACTASKSPDSSHSLQLYFTATDPHGPAIVGQPYPASQSPSPRDLILALLNGPENDALSSPFPRGLTLRGCKLEDGHLLVNFSEQYGGLADISLTLADYCLVLTLCQLEGVERVEITVMGNPIPHRSHQILTAQEALLALEDSTSP